MKARVALLAFILLAGCGPAKEKGSDSPVLARVNQAPISVSRFKEKLRFLKLGFSNLSSEMSGGEEAKLDLLSQLIDEEMYVQEATKLGIEASGSEVDARLAKAESEFNGDFRKVLKQEDIDIDELKEDLKRRITAEKLINSQVYSKIKVDVTEAKAFFEKNRREFRRPLRIRARQIVVDRQEEARHIMGELLKGADFSLLAKANAVGQLPLEATWAISQRRDAAAIRGCHVQYETGQDKRDCKVPLRLPHIQGGGSDQGAGAHLP
jgi:hypothetical protein